MRFTRMCLLLALSTPIATVVMAQAPGPSRGQRYERLLIQNALVIDGTGNPTRGPFDILIEGGRVAQMTRSVPRDEFGSIPEDADEISADRIIDATGMYVMPGIIDVHGHTQFERNGVPMPKDYVYKLWLSHGITTIRDPGSGEGLDTMVAHAALSAQNQISAPTILPYATIENADTPEAARQAVRDVKGRGGRGLKVFITRPDVFAAVMEEARAQDLPVAMDMKVQELDALDAARHGVRSLEHWYGIPDAAIPGGVQDFPGEYNYDDELDRFRWAGDLWRQADPGRLSTVLDSMLANDVTWDPTFAVYEANRDLTRARNLPWLEEYALPNVLDFFEPDPERHGSYHVDWTTADEVMWRENFRIWMSWVREYANRGGNVTIGSDAGFIYQLYGFATIREMELHLEAGFHPLEVIRHATSNAAKALGLDNTGVVRLGFDADLLVVDGNPLHNLKVLYGTGVVSLEDGEMQRSGAVQYTIKKGIVFDAPALLREVREMVQAAKANRQAGGGG